MFPENPQFLDRPDVMSRIRGVLNHEVPCQRRRVMALHGTGGIGKTQIALAYAYERKHAGVDAIFWVNSETNFEIAQGFSEICKRLALPGYDQDAQHDNNRRLVLEWLRIASMSIVIRPSLRSTDAYRYTLVTCF